MVLKGGAKALGCVDNRVLECRTSGCEQCSANQSIHFWLTVPIQVSDGRVDGVLKNTIHEVATAQPAL